VRSPRDLIYQCRFLGERSCDMTDFETIQGGGELGARPRLRASGILGEQRQQHRVPLLITRRIALSLSAISFL
jgi:hypothetical protein